MKHARAAFGILLASLLLAAGPALAVADDFHRHATRDGFLVGFSLGFGSTFPCDVCPSLGGDIHIGAMAGRNVAVMADFNVVGGDEGPLGEPGSLGVAAIAVQFWPVERFWLKGGVGVGNTFSFEEDGDWGDDWDDDWNDEPGPDGDVTTGKRRWAAIAAAGFELVQKGPFAMDLQVRGAFTDGNQSVQVGIGFNWY
jgi:hypothetical protein